MILNPEHFWQYYYYIGLFATILFVIKLIIFSFAGGDSEVFGDFNSETDTDVSFNFFSIQSIIAFFMGFGWMGYAGIKQLNLTNQIETLVIAIIAGLVFMTLSSTLMFLAKKLEKNIKKDKNSALNKVGRAYTKFSPKGSGQIEIEINGQLSIEKAINKSEEEIAAFESVTVVAVIGETLYIEKNKE
jgi:membrane-bound ClpP family serine protease